MTQKELSYVEDAIEHEKNLISICNETINLLTDDSLVSFLKNEVTRHSTTKERLLNVLEVKANE